MGTAQKGERLVRVNRLGGILVGLALLTVIVAYPPPATGLEPLLGAGTMFLPLVASIASLVIALVGGVSLARGVTQAHFERTSRLLVSVVVPFGVVAIISAYLVTVAGFGPQSPFIIGAMLLAIIGGAAEVIR